MPGLLVNGTEHPVQDLVIINPNDAAWCRLDPKDFRARPTSWVRQIILHTTKGDWPQHVLPGRGPGGRAERVADMWRSDPTSSGSHIVIDNDGTVACLCDLATVEAFHATVSNAWSIGIEMYQEADNGVYEAVYAAAVKLVPALCRIFGIQFQIPKLPYRNEPLRRMADGGEQCVGVFGHRDNTGQRGHGDPGDEIFARLAAAGAERFDHDAGEDLDVWKDRQRTLNGAGATLTIDGVPGPHTIEALKAAGHADGIWALRESVESWVGTIARRAETEARHELLDMNEASRRRAEVGAKKGDTMDIGSFGLEVLKVLSPVLLAALTAATTKFAQLIRARVQNEYLRGVLIRLDEAVFTAVKNLQQSTVDRIKAASADGKISDDEKKWIREAALDIVKSNLGAKGRAEIAKILGLQGEGMDGLLSSKVEAAVHDLRRTVATPGGSVRGATPSSLVAA